MCYYYPIEMGLRRYLKTLTKGFLDVKPPIMTSKEAILLSDELLRLKAEVALLSDTVNSHVSRIVKLQTDRLRHFNAQLENPKNSEKLNHFQSSQRAYMEKVIAQGQGRT